MSSVRNSTRRAFLPVVLAFSLLAALPASGHGSAQQTKSPAGELGKIRSLAESQHEIVMLLIGKKEFAQAAKEAAKIFEMQWPEDQEPLLLKEMRYLSEQLLLNKQHAMAIGLLETNIKAFKRPGSRAAVWKEKGYIYKSMNDSDKALDCFREAQRIESNEKQQ